MNKLKISITDILIGILFTVFFVSTALIIVINSRFLYYNNIEYLNIEELSGLDKETIIENYDALITYCSPFHREELNLPSLPSSEQGINHFEETKEIFVFFYYLALITAIILLCIILYKKKRHDTSYLRTSAYTVIILPSLIGIAAAINFEKLFLSFHKFTFNNDDWLFDPLTDPIINILPEEFFKYCAVEIVLLVILGALILFLCDKLTKKHANKLQDLK